MNKRISVLTVIVLLGAAFLTGCKKEDLNAQKIENPKFSDSISNIETFLKQNKFQGAVLIAKKNKIILANGYGLCDSRNKKSDPIEINTVFEVGSLTKQMTAAAIMQLSEKKLLSINDPLSKYFPDFEKGQNITIEMLLKMRSGLTDIVNSTEDFFPHQIYRQIEKNYLLNKPLEDGLVLKYLPQSPIISAPDSTYFYCNTNYYLLARIIEQVSNQSYYDYIQENIFARADMQNSNQTFQNTQTRGYDLKKRYYSIPSELSLGCGDVNSSVVDLYKWNCALRSGKIVSKKSYKKMINTTSYGYGLNNQNGEVFHSGVTGVFNSYMSYYPKSKIQIIVLINQPVSEKNAAVISRRIYDILMNDVPKK